MTLILRVEDTEGRGPYSNSLTYRKSAVYAHEMGGCPISMTQHPDPYQDDALADAWINMRNSQHPHLTALGTRFGFPTAAAYFNWFSTTKARDILHDSGFRISLYFVPDDRCVVASKVQALFDRIKANWVGAIACNSTQDEIELGASRKYSEYAA